MNARTAGLGTGALAQESTAAGPACAHCGEPASRSGAAQVRDADGNPYCCDGCLAAARWIRDADLGDYYRLRTAAAGRVGDDLPDLSAWDREDLLREHAHAVDGGRRITLLTDGMRCAACAWLIQKALAREPGVREVTANAVTGRVRIDWDPGRTPLSAVLRRLASLGYRPYLATGDARERARIAERNRWLLRLGIAGIGMFQAMMMAEALYLDFDSTMAPATRDFFRWLTFLLSTPVVFYSGWPFLAGMWRELRERHVGMDTLIATSTLLAYFASVFETIRGGAHVWYDAAVMFVFLLLAARMLEQRARNVASAQVDALARARPAFATRETSSGSRESVPLSELRVDDVACVAAGEPVPADGVLLDGPAWLEESLLTGEPGAVRREPGDTVYAGTVNREAPARVRVTCTGPQTRLSQLTRLVEEAQSHRPRLARVADRVGSRFVVGLLATAALVYLGWRIHDPSRAFEVTLALLVISCPCALSLAVPTALAAAHGALARAGVLATRADALDTLAKATDLVFDKTGTLSDERPVLAGVETFAGFDRDAALAIAAALERDAGHPFAAAFAQADARLAVADARSVPGHGVEGVVQGRHWRLGQAAFAGGGADDGAIWLGDGRSAVARFVLRETLRPDAAEAVSALRALGLRLHLCSGDAAAPVQAAAAALGIDDVHARQRPEDKLAVVRELQSRGRIVAMVGDGLNDAPVLAGADVSLAMDRGAALAQRAADLVMTGPTLLRIPAAVRLARRSRRVIRQNFGWALGYNVLAVPLAAAGLVTPLVAAIGMAGSSLLVTLNALRLARRPS
ncbi:Cu2+-exporting ATPase [Luteimonas sp. J16]|uniref:heavy metal translocating P-type ATPase n=1 Tax=unclassified Luteimonas TaxID=2629088 RepID=UPI000479CD64|nr:MULTISPECIES: heavy metal translocating P-type ATPase [unclassified Luteimonas]TWG86189.1 Cu2+-exporting ATPase [Luteimonas sp. J16]